MGSSTIPKEGLIGPFPNSPDLGFCYRHATSIIPLTHYCPVLPIFSRENIKKPKGCNELKVPNYYLASCLETGLPFSTSTSLKVFIYYTQNIQPSKICIKLLNTSKILKKGGISWNHFQAVTSVTCVVHSKRKRDLKSTFGEGFIAFIQCVISRIHSYFQFFGLVKSKFCIFPIYLKFPLLQLMLHSRP